MLSIAKRKKIKDIYKEVQKITSGVPCVCTNEKCKAKVTLTQEETERVILCSKCNKGFFVKKPIETKEEFSHKNKTTKHISSK